MRERTENCLEPIAIHENVDGQAPRVLDDILVHERRSGFESMEHRRAVDLREILGDELRVPIVLQILLEDVTTGSQRPRNCSLGNRGVFHSFAENTEGVVAGQAVVRDCQRSKTTDAVIDKVCEPTQPTTRP